MVKSSDCGARPEDVRLAPNRVQVWRLDLTDGWDRRWLDSAWHLLQTDEVARAGRMRAEVAREEFVAGRAALRWLLGRELGCEPREVALRVGRHGKPELADAASGLDFNVAHSKGRVLIALSRAGVVGIDIEQENKAIEAMELARSTFHADDLGCIEQAEEADRADLFFCCWTRKEAVGKADGRGLTLPLESFSVGISFNRLMEYAVEGYVFDKTGYSVRDLAVAPGFAAALAIAASGACVSMHDLRACADFRIDAAVSYVHTVIFPYTG